MGDYLEIGSSPYEEDCAQVGSENYRARALLEYRAYISQLRREFGPEPAGARLRIKANAHDFGTYHEVVCDFDDTLAGSVDYAYRLESDGPARWDNEALAELKKGGVI